LYEQNIANNLAASRAAYETAVKLAPSSSPAIGALGSTEAEAAAGEWEAALKHDREAATLDPRSALPAARLALLLLYLRRYPEARAEAERGLLAVPTDPSLVADRAASFIGEGDVAAARAALRDVAPELDRATLVVYATRNSRLSTFGSRLAYWVLDGADRALVLTLSPAAFDNNRAEWGRARAELYWLAGDTTRARHYADSALVTFDAQIAGAPNVYDLYLYRGLLLAHLGQRVGAVQEGEHGLALAQATKNSFIIPYARQVLARIYVATGDHGRAIAQLDSLLALPYYVSPAWLKVDPTWAPLRGDPRFERLLAQPPMSPAAGTPEPAR
jgi:tetratricopeptide (TPR) repeat protein